MIKPIKRSKKIKLYFLKKVLLIKLPIKISPEIREKDINVWINPIYNGSIKMFIYTFNLIALVKYLTSSLQFLYPILTVRKYFSVGNLKGVFFVIV